MEQFNYRGTERIHVTRSFPPSTGSCAARQGLGSEPRLRQPVLPIIRLAMEVGNGNNQYFVFLVSVNDAVRKATGLTSPRSFRTRLPRLRKPGDPVQCLRYFGEELIAQTGQLVIVEPDGFVQFDFCDFEKSNSHLFVFGQDFFE